MRRVENITAEPHQRHILLFQQSEIVLTLRFYPRTEIWVFDVEYGGRAIYGVKLSVGVPHMVSKNFPFDFLVNDRSNNGLDPFRREDFAEERCRLFLLEPDDMVDVRGGEVSL